MEWISVDDNLPMQMCGCCLIPTYDWVLVSDGVCRYAIARYGDDGWEFAETNEQEVGCPGYADCWMSMALTEIAYWCNPWPSLQRLVVNQPTASNY